MKSSKRLKLALAKLSQPVKIINEVIKLVPPVEGYHLTIRELNQCFKRLPKAASHPRDSFRITLEEQKEIPSEWGSVMQEYERVAHAYIYFKKVERNVKGKRKIVWQITTTIESDF